jgi:hypothetical protein
MAEQVPNGELPIGQVVAEGGGQAPASWLDYCLTIAGIVTIIAVAVRNFFILLSFFIFLSFFLNDDTFAFAFACLYNLLTARIINDNLDI